MPQVHHSDVIGSLLRPRYLQQARDAYAAGQLPAPDFKRIEDRAVDQAIAMQEGIGLDVITDGELRRFSFLDQVVARSTGWPRLKARRSTSRTRKPTGCGTTPSS
jgi:5-methyltetrahydropteroyltriglutamate--homocysteine methyltransferase